MARVRAGAGLSGAPACGPAVIAGLPWPTAQAGAAVPGLELEAPPGRWIRRIADDPGELPVRLAGDHYARGLPVPDRVMVIAAR